MIVMGDSVTLAGLCIVAAVLMVYAVVLRRRVERIEAIDGWDCGEAEMNRDEIMALTADELRLAIANAKGWNVRLAEEWQSKEDNVLGVGVIHFVGEYCTETRDWIYAGTPVQQLEDGDVRELPDWPANIADAWELEGEITTIPEKRRYINFLIDVCTWSEWGATDFYWALIHAPAEQRCRAWLLWKREEK
jgi:hypothetical protein